MYGLFQNHEFVNLPLVEIGRTQSAYLLLHQQPLSVIFGHYALWVILSYGPQKKGLNH